MLRREFNEFEVDSVTALDVARTRAARSSLQSAESPRRLPRARPAGGPPAKTDQELFAVDELLLQRRPKRRRGSASPAMGTRSRFRPNRCSTPASPEFRTWSTHSMASWRASTIPGSIGATSCRGRGSSWRRASTGTPRSSSPGVSTSPRPSSNVMGARPTRSSVCTQAATHRHHPHRPRSTRSAYAAKRILFVGLRWELKGGPAVGRGLPPGPRGSSGRQPDHRRLQS